MQNPRRTITIYANKSEMREDAIKISAYTIDEQQLINVLNVKRGLHAFVVRVTARRAKFLSSIGPSLVLDPQQCNYPTLSFYQPFIKHYLL